jgi:pyridoxine 4-dehydrogenase
MKILPGGSFTFPDGQSVARLGYGAMRITGRGIWGEPTDRDGAIAVLRRAVDLGVTLIDTADSYGPFVSEDLIREALHPYDGLLIATKAGLTRQGPDRWLPVGRPEYLRQCVEMSLRRLRVETIDLWQLHRIDPAVPAADQFGLLADLVTEGKVRAVGLSEVSVDELEAARQFVPIVSVQNLYNLTERRSQELLRHCEANGIGFMPWFPIAAGKLIGEGSPVARIADRLGATQAQVSLAWLLATSPVILPIPGTSSVAHLEENMAAASLALDAATMTELDSLAP